jgi:hypothetical protein
MSRVRVPSLAELLGEYMQESVGMTFSWEGANCCHFAAGWVERATGHNPMAGLQPITSALQALRLIEDLGGSLQAAWTRQLGRESIAPAFAQMGDVVLLPLRLHSGEPLVTGQIVGVCMGAQAVVMSSDGFHVFLPMSAAVAAWPLRDRA